MSGASKATVRGCWVQRWRSDKIHGECSDRTSAWRRDEQQRPAICTIRHNKLCARVCHTPDWRTSYLGFVKGATRGNSLIWCLTRCQRIGKGSGPTRTANAIRAMPFVGQKQWHCGTRLHTRIFTEEHGQTNSVPPATDCYAGNYVLQS